MVKNTYGTGCFMLMHTGGRAVDSRKGLLTTVAWRFGERREFALEGSVFIAGAAVQWLRDGLGIINSAAQVGHLASSVEDNGGVYVVPAFAGLGAPHWDPYARGALVGLTRATTAGHLARAALEGIAYQVAKNTVLRVGGGRYFGENDNIEFGGAAFAQGPPRFYTVTVSPNRETTSVILQNGNVAYDRDMFVQWVHVFSCPAWQTAQCNRSVITTPP